MKKTNVVFSLVAAAGVLLAGCSKKDSAGSGQSGASFTPPKGPVELKVKWPVGGKYGFRMEMHQVLEVELSSHPQPVKQTMNMSQDLAITVIKELAGGGRQLDLLFTAQKFEMSMGERKMLSFDSAQDPSRDSRNPAAALLRKMIGARIQLLTDAEGKVEKVEGFEALVNHVAGTNTQMQGMFRQFFNPESFKQYCSFANDLPKQPVKPGDTWPGRGEMEGPMGIVGWDTKCAFEDWEPREGRTCVRWEHTGSLSSKPGSNGKSLNIKKGKTAGDTWFDPELGMIVQSVRQDTMTLAGEGEGKVAPEIEQKSTFTLIEVAGR